MLVAERDKLGLRRTLMCERRRGGQSFVVVPRVEDIAVERELRELRELVPELVIRVAHG
jgi:transcription-repair coupling factor (superfamily II helicase)